MARDRGSARRLRPVVAVLLAFACATALTGCRLMSDQATTSPGSTREKLEFGGIERTYLLHVPPSYRQGSPAPLVLVFHGGTRNAQSMETLTGMSEKADREGFIAVYPDGTGRLENIFVWNVEFGFGYALRNGVDDVGFIDSLIGELQKKLSIDGKRIFATGISNGGMLSYLVASRLSGRFAAVAPVAGASGGSEKAGSPIIIYGRPEQPVSVIVFHGKSDRLVPYAGGQGSGFANAVYIPVKESIDLWVGYDGCSPAPVSATSAGGNVIKDGYSGGRDGTEVVLYTIVDGGHAWPGGTPAWEGGDRPTPDINATDLIWEFFKAHPKQR